MIQVDSIQERGQVFLPVSINGRDEWHYFILDTGAGMSALEQKIAEELDLPTIGRTELAGTAGTLEVPIKQIDSITPLRRLRPVTELTQYGLPATTQDLSAFEVPLPGTREAGLLGNDYLRHFVVEVSFLPPALYIARTSGYVPPGVGPDYFIPMWLDGNKIMRVRGRLDDWLDVELRLDSGAATLKLPQEGPYLDITTPMWRRLRERRPEYEFYTQLSAGGMGGTVDLDVGRISALEIGPLRWERPSVVVQPEQGIFASPDAVGFIALSLFEPGKWMTFDYVAGRIYLPGPAAGAE